MEWLAVMAVQLAVGVLTLAISVELKPEHFAVALRQPRALAVGLAVQLATLPTLVLGLSLLVQDATLLAALCLVALAPSGPTSNYLAHLARGDVALAILLTMLATLLSAAVMPLALPWLLEATTGTRLGVVRPPAILQNLFWMVLLPLGAGFYLTRSQPGLTRHLRPILGKVAAVLFVLLLAAAITSQRTVLVQAATAFALPVAGVNACALALGALAGLLGGLAPPQRTSLALKAGVQNVSIAIGVAVGVLGRMDVAAVAALYGVTQLVVASVFALMCRARSRGGALPG